MWFASGNLNNQFGINDKPNSFILQLKILAIKAYIWLEIIHVWLLVTDNDRFPHFAWNRMILVICWPVIIEKILKKDHIRNVLLLGHHFGTTPLCGIRVQEKETVFACWIFYFWFLPIQLKANWLCHWRKSFCLLLSYTERERHYRISNKQLTYNYISYSQND